MQQARHIGLENMAFAFDRRRFMRHVLFWPPNASNKASAAAPQYCGRRALFQGRTPAKKSSRPEIAGRLMSHCKMSDPDAALAGGLRQCGKCRISAMDNSNIAVAKQQAKGAREAEL
jgi:hypothetical protein